MYTCMWLYLYFPLPSLSFAVRDERTRGESRTLEHLRVHKARRIAVALSRGRPCAPSAGGGCRGIAAENEDGKMEEGEMEESAVAPGATAAATEGAKGVVRERTRVFFHHQLLAASANPSRSRRARGSEQGREARANSQTVKVPNSYRLLHASSSVFLISKQG